MYVLCLFYYVKNKEFSSLFSQTPPLLKIHEGYKVLRYISCFSRKTFACKHKKNELILQKQLNQNEQR